MITTIIVTSKRHGLLTRCLHSVIAENQNALVVVNGEDSKSVEICESLSVPHLLIRERVNPSEARNIAAQHVITTWIHFLDDDAFVDRGFYTRARMILKETSYSVVGGANLTPPGSEFFQEVSGLALSSFWSAGPQSRRYKMTKDSECGEESLILCNLFFKKSVFLQRQFPSEFFCGEENALLNECRSNGEKFFISSDLAVWHERRENVFLFLRQIWNYGVGRGQNISQAFNFSRYHLVPFLALITTVVAALQSWPRWFIVLAGCYIFLNLIAAMTLALKTKRKFSSFVLLVFLIPSIHLFYGLGTGFGALYLKNVFQDGFAFFKALKLFSKKNFEQN